MARMPLPGSAPQTMFTPEPADARELLRAMTALNELKHLHPAHADKAAGRQHGRERLARGFRGSLKGLLSLCDRSGSMPADMRIGSSNNNV
jgi:hypothetical protein